MTDSIHIIHIKTLGIELLLFPSSLSLTLSFLSPLDTVRSVGTELVSKIKAHLICGLWSKIEQPFKQKAAFEKRLSS